MVVVAGVVVVVLVVVVLVVVVGLVVVDVDGGDVGGKKVTTSEFGFGGLGGLVGLLFDVAHCHFVCYGVKSQLIIK